MQSGGEIPRSLSERWGGGSESRTRATSERHSDHAASPTRALHYELRTCQAYESTRREFSRRKERLLISDEEYWMYTLHSCTRDNEQRRTIKTNICLVPKRKRVSLHAMAATHALDSGDGTRGKFNRNFPRLAIFAFVIFITKFPHDALKQSCKKWIIWGW